MSGTDPSHTSIFIAAGEHSGDALAAELVAAMRERGDDGLSFFGAAGPRMRASGVECIVDLTVESVVGLWEAIQKGIRFKFLMDRLRDEILFRKPQVFIVVDNSGFNLRLIEAVTDHVRLHESSEGWHPKIVYFISPQVWASRPGRARSIERNVDLLLSVFPFEKEWYREHAPQLRVECIGHPIADRFAGRDVGQSDRSGRSRVVLLPGSRAGELRRHLPVIATAISHLRATHDVTFEMVLPNEEMVALAGTLLPRSHGISIRTGSLVEALAKADFAIASSGTVTLECAWLGVPTIVLYKTSPLTYAIARRVVTVDWIAMPNILLGREIFPEFIQLEATPSNLEAAARAWLDNTDELATVRSELAGLREMLGGPGACDRAAGHVLELIQRKGDD